MEQWITQNQWIVIIATAWTLAWKGKALWIAALKRHQYWFIALLFVQTLGILDIAYILYFSNRKYRLARVFTQTFAAVAALIEKDGKFLLVQEGYAGADTGKWNLPAGWLEVGEDPLFAVKKEVREEAGLEFEPKKIVGIFSLVRNDLRNNLYNAPHGVRFVFSGVVTGGELKPEEPDEITDVKYFTAEEIEAMDGGVLRDADIKRAVRDYQAGVSCSLDVLHHTVVS